jgi:UDP-N-acetylglucosamine acyltransferase
VKAADPQGDEESGVNIGDNNVFREYVTVHRSMYPYNYTSLGNNNYIMSGVHIAHDCKIGNNVVITNYTGLTGHVEIEDNVVISGLVAIHQFVRIGTLAMIGGNSKVTQDVIPYMLADGHPAKIRSINTVGLKRFSWDEESRNILKQIIRILYFSNSSLKEALAEIEERWGNLDFIQHLINFIRNSKRGICGPMRRK